MKTLSDLEKIYEIDFGKIVREIKKSKAKLVLLQFADGLKPYATAVVDFLEEKTAPKGVPRNISPEMFTKGNDVEFLIWLGDCFGACDTPVLPTEIKVDLVMQVGHNGLMAKI